MSMYLVIGESESGDAYYALFEKEPSDEKLSELAHEWDGDDDKEGIGFDGSWVEIEVMEIEVED